MLVRKADGQWNEWRGTNDPFVVVVDTVRVRFDDDDNTEIVVPVRDITIEGSPMEPYTRTVLLSAAAVERAVAQGAWSSDALARHGLAVPTPFVVPDGKQPVGQPRYVEQEDGTVAQVFDVEDEPPPPPPPTRQERVAKLLRAFDLTPEDLADVLGLPERAAPADAHARS